MTKTQTWKTRRLEIKRRKRLRVQRETRLLLARNPVFCYRRQALAHERRVRLAANRAKHNARREQKAEWVAAWVDEGRSKPTEPSRRVAIVDGSSRSAMMLSMMLMVAGLSDDR